MPVLGWTLSSARPALKVRAWPSARCKMWWAKMDAVELATEGPPEGKEHRTPERYFGDVLEGSRIAVEQCAKDVIFE